MDTTYFNTNSSIGIVEGIKKEQRFRAEMTAVAIDGSYGGTLLMISMFGVAQSVDAIRSLISLGKEISVQIKGMDAWPSVVKTRGQKFQFAASRLKPTRRDHVVAVNTLLLEDPIGSTTSYVWSPQGEPAQTHVSARLRELMPILILPEWDQILYDYGVQAKKIVAVKQKGVNIQKIILDAPTDPQKLWEHGIRSGVQSGKLPWPKELVR